jgi:protocatechuate 4,5-dioxygenase beta chain/2,3-dihydroxyphenylpropionate 1,2-dioxygenase
MLSCHAPALFLRQPGEDPAQLDATTAAMRQLGRVLDETKPDALIVFGLDHLEAFSLDVSPAFALVVGPEVAGSFGRKEYHVTVHQELARAILDGCLKRDFDMAFCHKAFMGHAFIVPFEFILEERQIPIVPIFVNVYVPPLPQPHRAYHRALYHGDRRRAPGARSYPGSEPSLGAEGTTVVPIRARLRYESARRKAVC